MVGDQQVKALMDQLKATYPDEYAWLLSGEGDWHCMVNAVGVFADLLKHAGLVQASKECGFKQLYKDGGKVKWRDQHL